MEADHGNGPISVSVINLKGGVGKSTIAALLARYASRRGRKVLAIDMDPQANLSQAFMWNGYKKFLKDKRPSIVEVFREYRPPSLGTGSPSMLDPADVVVDVGPNLQLIPSRFDFSDNLVGGIKPDPLVLARFLSANFGDRDLIFIDCAPTESVFTVAAYGASRYVLVPVKPEYFATIGFPLLQESLDKYRSGNRGHQIDVIGVVVNHAFYDGGNRGGPETRRSLREIKKEARRNEWRLFDNELPHSRGFPKMMRGDYSNLGNAVFHEDFAQEFLERIEGRETNG